MGSLLRAVVVLLVVCTGGIALAGRSGGRMGGGSWGSHSSSSSYHSSSSSSSSHSWSSHSSSSSSSWSSSSSSPTHYYSSGTSYSSGSSSFGDDSAIIFVIFIGVLVVAAVIGAIYKRMNEDTYSPPSFSTAYASPPMGTVDVSVLRIVIDGRSRKMVQSELARIAKVADTSTSAGRAAMLREVALMLRRLRDAWIYGGAVNEAMTSESGAKVLFDRHVDDTRARFDTETIVNVDGKQQGVASDTEYVPHASEGAGVILVSIVLAAYNELYTVLKIGDGEDLRKALENAAYRDPDDLIAVEIIWQPSEEADRMSSVQLEAKYPHPQLIKITGALAGKTFCEYCSGPYPAELLTCPHCGAAGRKTA